MEKKQTILYATTNDFKREEIAQIFSSCELENISGKPVHAGEAFEVQFTDIHTDEPLERNLETMVRHKVKSAYSRLLAPCIVEHAGLILEGYEDQNFPGGLTQPMWDALGAKKFVRTLNWAGNKVVARAVVGYCDGHRIRVFSGETSGLLSEEPKGKRDFYWDPVFCPEGAAGLTYAELADQKGLQEKIKLSQSTKAIHECLQEVLLSPPKLY